MVRKSYGKMRGTHFKMQVRKKPTIGTYMQQFSVGDVVHVNLLSSSPFPHPRFQGLTGIIEEKRGESYVVKLSSGKKIKKISLRPEHLKLEVAGGNK
ncbi:MAG: 50S ribosomal protein L21e [Candidatus Aenigmarchaeota archaeon]|nr:50S ribosomal protein L21e [Candidatus Aenigmarchaeota archaeon]